MDLTLLLVLLQSGWGRAFLATIGEVDYGQAFWKVGTELLVAGQLSMGLGAGPFGLVVAAALLREGPRMGRTRAAFILMVLMLFAAGCAGIVPSHLREQIERSITLRDLQRDPEAHRGRLVILGGEILEDRVQADQHAIEILHRPLDTRDRPILTGESQGRFVVRIRNLAPPLGIGFREGQPITVVGEVTGEVAPRPGKDLPSPILAARYLHPWSAADYAPPPPVYFYRHPFFRFGPGRLRNPCD